MAGTVAIPTTPEELQEALTDKKALTALIEDGGFPKFMANYANEFGKTKVGVDVNANVQEQIDQAFASFAKEHLVDVKRPNLMPANPREVALGKKVGAGYSAKADGAKLDGKFTDLMDFLETVHTSRDPREGDTAARRKGIRDAMSSTDPASGGFLIPEEFRATLLRVALETAIVRPRARVLPMASLRAAIPTIDTTSNSGSIYGGVIAYWTEEGAALVQSQPAFSRVVLEAKKLTAYTEVPNELRQDSAITVDALLGEIFPQAIAWFEDIAFLRGSGAGEPLGVLNPQNNALVAQTKETGQATGTIVWENVLGMYARMLPSSLNNAVWIVSPDAFPQLATMALSVGTGGAPVWLPNGADSPYSTLLGRPVIISEKVNALSNSATAGLAGSFGSDVNFIDFSQYLIGDRMAMDAQASTDYRFGNDITAYRFIERVDGKPWMQSAITPNNSSPTLSPYVILGAR